MATNNSSNQKNQGVAYYNGTGSWSGVDAGTATYVLTSNGTGVAPSFQPSSGGGSSNLVITSVNAAASPYTVLVGDQFLSIDCSGGSVTIRCPNTTTTGRVLYFKDKTGNAFTNNITITTPGGTVTFDGSTSYTMNVNFQVVQVVFDGSNYEVF